MRHFDTAASPLIVQLDLLMEVTLEHTKSLRTISPTPRGNQHDECEERSSTPSHTLDDLDLFLGRVYQIKRMVVA